MNKLIISVSNNILRSISDIALSLTSSNDYIKFSSLKDTVIVRHNNQVSTFDSIESFFESIDMSKSNSFKLN